MNSTIASLLKVGVPYALIARYVDYARLLASIDRQKKGRG